MWEDTDEAGDIGPLNPNKLSLPVEAVSPPLMEVASPPTFDGNNPTLPEGNIMASSEAVDIERV